MEIGDRIRQRRLEMNMSQDELARKVGYKSRSSINKIESDGRGLPQSKIVAFAKALDTTPAALMGWLDEPEPADPDPVTLTFEEQTLLRNYKQLNRDGQLHLLEYADNMTHMLKYSKETSLTEENIG